LNLNHILPFSASVITPLAAKKSQFPEKSLTAVVTDPPYYDAIAYADLSDFFYVWLKRTLGDVVSAKLRYAANPEKRGMYCPQTSS
jgi:adenine-specific DNA methylase